MALIEEEIKLMGSKGEHELADLFDSRATYSCIDQDLAEELEILIPLPIPISLEMAENWGSHDASGVSNSTSRRTR